MSESKIKCPNCGTQIDIDEVLNHQAEERINEKMKLKENELLAKEKEFEEKRIRAQEEYKLKLEADRQRIAKEETEKANQKAKEEFELSIKKLEEENAARKEENQALKNQRLELLKKKNS
jgi:hypothetical protein